MTSRPLLLSVISLDIRPLLCHLFPTSRAAHFLRGQRCNIHPHLSMSLTSGRPSPRHPVTTLRPGRWRPTRRLQRAPRRRRSGAWETGCSAVPRVASGLVSWLLGLVKKINDRQRQRSVAMCWVISRRKCRDVTREYGLRTLLGQFWA